MSETETGFGKASLEGNFDGFKRFKLQTPDTRKGQDKTELILRLLPPMKTYAESGAWKFFYGQHFGIEGNNTRDPSKGRPRPFLCIQRKNKAKEVIVPCAKCEQMDKVRVRIDARENELAKEHGIEDKKSKEFGDLKRADQKLKPLYDWMKRHNVDKKFHINAMNEAGECGVLTLSYTVVLEKLEPLLKELRDKYRVDAFDPAGGVWLRFTRTGQAPRVNDSVEVFNEELADGAFRRKVAPMTADQIKKALKVCPDLSNVNQEIVRVLTAEAIQALVALKGDKDGKSLKDQVDAIWVPFDKEYEAAKAARSGKPAPVAAVAPEPVVEDYDPTIDESAVDVQEASSASRKPASAPQPEIPAVEPVSEEDAEEKALAAQMAAVQAKKAAKAAAAKKAAEATPAAEKIGVVEGPDDFLSQFEAK